MVTIPNFLQDMLDGEDDSSDDEDDEDDSSDEEIDATPKVSILLPFSFLKRRLVVHSRILPVPRLRVCIYFIGTSASCVSAAKGHQSIRIYRPKLGRRGL